MRVILILCIFIGAVWANDLPENIKSSIEDIFVEKIFDLKTYGPLKWLENGKGYTTLEWSDNHIGSKNIVKHDPKSGAQEVLIDAGQLIPAQDSLPLVIDDYSWSGDGKKLLIFTNTKRVWRDNTRGDYWIYDLKKQLLWQIGKGLPESSLMFAKFSPNGRQISYVCRNNIYLENLQNGAIRKLTADGSETIINGTFDWVYEEELDNQDGFRWSPDGKNIAFWQLDASGIGYFNMVNYTDSIYSKIIPIQYPKVGTQNSAAKIGNIEVATGKIRWMKIGGDPRNNYLARMEWANNSEELIIQQLNRLQNNNAVLMADANSGKVDTLFVEAETAWLDAVDDLKWMKKGKAFTWISEKNGWRNIYSISRNGQSKQQIGNINFDVISIYNIDTKNGWIYFEASPDEPAERYLYRVKIKKNARAERLTPKNLPGTHSYKISPDGKYAIHTYNNFQSPDVISLISLPDHQRIRVLESNKKARKNYAELQKGKVTFSRIEIGKGIHLPSWEILPVNFDPDKKYPVLFFIYGEPAGQRVTNKWWKHRYLWHNMLAQNGYIVMAVDNRGTPGPLGREWRKCIYEKIGILSSEDQAAALKEIIKRPYVDKDRIAIWGWSGGGSMSLNMIFRYPELYQTAMSIAPVANQRLYDTIYQERYMGLPSTNPDGFFNGSPVNFAKNLQGNLLLIHGSGDDNVHYQNSELIINELIKHNKYFQFMNYPNRSHSIREEENDTRHVFELMTRYLWKHTPAGGKDQ